MWTHYLTEKQYYNIATKKRGKNRPLVFLKIYSNCQHFNNLRNKQLNSKLCL